MKAARFFLILLVVLLSLGLVSAALGAAAASTPPAGPNVLQDEVPTKPPDETDDGETTAVSNHPYPNFYEGLSAAPNAVAICSSPVITIPDNTPAGISDTLFVDSSSRIVDLDVYINTTHTWVGDLAYTLTHIGTGTSAAFYDRPGVPASTFGCSGNDIDATISDEAANPVENECDAGTPAILGTFYGGDPPDPTLLTAFDGESLFGDWRLTVSDKAGGDTGTLDTWCILADVAEIQLEKTVGLDPTVCAGTDTIGVPAGTAVTYCYNIFNSGDITLTLHDLFDDQLGPILSGFPLVLGPFDSVWLTATAIVSETTINTAIWTASNPGPSDVVQAVDSATVFVNHGCGVPGNPVVNCSFESGDFSGWVPTDIITPFSQLTVTTAGYSPWMGFFSASPPDGDYAALNGFDGVTGTIRLAQDLFLPPGSLSLEFDYRAAWDLVSFVPTNTATLPRFFDVNIEPPGGGPPLQATTVLTAVPGTIVNDTGNFAGGLVDVSAFADSPVRINFVWVVPQEFTGPAFFQLDNVRVNRIPVIMEVNPPGLTAIQPPNNVETDTFSITSLGFIPLDWSIFENGTTLMLPDPASGAQYSEMQAGPGDPSKAVETIASAAERQPASAQPGRMPERVFSPSASGQLYDNGPLVNAPGGGFGGADASMLQNTSLGMNIIGFGHQTFAGNRIADEFTITDTAGWVVGDITFFAYQTSSPLTSTITGVNYRIWDGPPGLPGSNVVFGDTNRNRLLDTYWSGILRTTETLTDSIARPIMADVAAAGVYLPQGTYWLDWQTDGSPMYSGPWAPPITINGLITTGNSLQSLDNGVTWNPALDSGTGTQQGFPFLISGCVPEDIPWASTDPITGTLGEGMSTDVDVTFDSTGLVEGVYNGNLCIISNDLRRPVVDFPLELIVENLKLYLPNILKVFSP